jgi:hypothetical protein
MEKKSSRNFVFISKKKRKKSFKTIEEPDETSKIQELMADLLHYLILLSQ